MKKIAFFLSAVLLLILSVSPVFAATESPEKETLALSKILKPIPDSEWQAITGGRTEQNYAITSGDTLYTVSKRLFGDGKYWPKIWALNNQKITNPHVIRPGNLIAFMPGTGASLPSVAIHSDSMVLVESPIPPGSFDQDPSAKPQYVAEGPRSQEWRTLPHQPWEDAVTKIPVEVDKNGFDRRSRVNFQTPKGFDPFLIVKTEKIPEFGKILGARTDKTYITTGDTVVITPETDNDIQVGEIYSISAEPTILRPRSGKSGFVYDILGRVQVIGVRDGKFIATVTYCHHLIERDALVVPFQERYLEPKIIPGPSPLEASLIIEKTYAQEAAIQNRWVYVDRGSEDGLQPGMVFRIYQHMDPQSHRDLTDANVLILGDVIVLQTSEKFSLGLVIRSIRELKDDEPAFLLTDVSDLTGRRDMNDRYVDEQGKKYDELDELEKMDETENLGRDEEKELKQLERWKRGASPTPEPAPSETAVPTPAPTTPSTSVSPVPLTAPIPSPTATEPLPETPPPPPPPAATSTGAPSDSDPTLMPLTEPPPPPPSVNENNTIESAPPPAIETHGADAPPPPPPPPPSEP